MAFILHEDDIVTLQGNKKFLVCKCFTFNNENYAYMCNLVDPSKAKPQFFIATEKVKGEDAYIKILTDKNEVVPVLNELKRIYADEANAPKTVNEFLAGEEMFDLDYFNTENEE